MAVSQKLADHLRKHAVNNIHGQAIAELKAKADRDEAMGPKGQHTNLRKAIFDELVEIMPAGHVEWVEPYFFRGEVTIESYTDYSGNRDPVTNELPTRQKPYMQFGWRGGEYKFPKVSGFHDQVTFREETSQSYSRWHSGKSNGKVRIYVGDWGSKSQFKQLKDGTHRYGDIAQTIKNGYDGFIARIKAERARRSNMDQVQTVIEGLDHEFKPYRGVSIEPHSSATAPVTVKIDCTKSLTVDQATELLNLLAKFGIGHDLAK